MTRWSGPRWKLWSFIAGVACVPLALFVAYAIAAATDERVVPLILLNLVIVILGASFAGSGFIEKLSSPLTRGGLARESADMVEKSLSRSEQESAEQRDREARDRRTIRSGLFVIAPMIAFVYMMTII
ncbi:hypothetical protein BH23CHL2_BH23CHL2_30400 [soil metagenome]